MYQVDINVVYFSVVWFFRLYGFFGPLVIYLVLRFLFMRLSGFDRQTLSVFVALFQYVLGIFLADWATFEFFVWSH